MARYQLYLDKVLDSWLQEKAKDLVVSVQEVIRGVLRERYEEETKRAARA